MKGSDKAIVMGVIVAVVLAGFYFKVLSPKREKASALNKDIAELQTKVDEQNQAADFAEDARKHFPTYYGRLVVLGKAVPSDSGSSSLLVQLNSLARETHVKFDNLELSAGSGSTAATASTPPAAPPSGGTSGTSTTATGTTPTSTAPTSTSAATTTTPAPATEASAANLPIGAVVGTAGLPTLPYKLKFSGHYFDVANFLKGVDDLVHLRESGQVAADGRLLTVNGFGLALGDGSGGASPRLKVELVVTSYVTPSDQGLTAGASPGGPSSSLTQPETQPASATVTP
jgi:Tfp pilus assembly protein PilO